MNFIFLLNLKVCDCYLTSGIELSKKVKDNDLASNFVEIKKKTQENNHEEISNLNQKSCWGCSEKSEIMYKCKNCINFFCR